MGLSIRLDCKKKALKTTLVRLIMHAEVSHLNTTSSFPTRTLHTTTLCWAPLLLEVNTTTNTDDISHVIETVVSCTAASRLNETHRNARVLEHDVHLELVHIIFTRSPHVHIQTDTHTYALASTCGQLLLSQVFNYFLFKLQATRHSGASVKA